MSKYTWLLDAGHGGMLDDVYTTAPGKMHVFEDGHTFYEGVNNRMIVNKLRAILLRNGIEHRLIHDQVNDTPLAERVARANSLHAQGKNCIYLSVHSDAMPEGAHGKGSGFSVYTSVGKTRSDAIADVFCNTYQRRLGEFRLRKDLADGDQDKEQDFYVLRKTKCPALLTENLFFDNRAEAEFLLSETGQNRIAHTMFESIFQIETTKTI